MRCIDYYREAVDGISFVRREERQQFRAKCGREDRAQRARALLRAGWTSAKLKAGKCAPRELSLVCSLFKRNSVKE
jgi:hypothetical protein